MAGVGTPALQAKGAMRQQLILSYKRMLWANTDPINSLFTKNVYLMLFLMMDPTANQAKCRAKKVLILATASISSQLPPRKRIFVSISISFRLLSKPACMKPELLERLNTLKGDLDSLERRLNTEAQDALDEFERKMDSGVRDMTLTELARNSTLATQQ
ncbi:unnamed protein product [Dibothriocephalus latus]|uniref:Uncharacterized protein n=1 Tax=Dibothriocephalus latus TaxID=60516 RepID=A0A3P7LV51_DIBLA|nr:unnamed protein product [Dibothriocephalus latus]